MTTTNFAQYVIDLDNGGDQMIANAAILSNDITPEKQLEVLTATKEALEVLLAATCQQIDG